MTEKRFEVIWEDNNYEEFIVKDNQQDKEFRNEEIIDLMNEVNEDNNQLRILVESLKMENKKLKGRLNDLGVEYYD